jgi:5-methylcytosine-specific restriction endonuclease McrA
VALPKTMKSWTESYILSRIRSVLRRLSMQMPSIRECRLAVRRRYTGDNSRLKWEYPCARCGQWFPEKETHVDHIVPAGSLRSFDDVGPFARRLLFPAPEQLQILCKPCHKAKTTLERRDSRRKLTHAQTP